MRAGFEQLSAVVHERMSRSVTSGGLLVFCRRCRRWKKILFGDNDGCAIWYNRLEAGTFRVGVVDYMKDILGIDLEQRLSGIVLWRVILPKNVPQAMHRAP